MRVVAGKGWGGAKWKRAYDTLTGGGKQGLRVVSPQEAAKLKRGRWALVDVRTEDAFGRCTAAGAVNVPKYRLLEPTDPFRVAQMALFMSLDTTPVEENPDFAEQIAAAAQGARGVVLCCAEGGSLESTPSFPSGKTSRSLVAAYLALEEAGLKNVAWMEGGLNAYMRAGLPAEGPEEWQYDARTPGSASPPEDRIDARTGTKKAPAVAKSGTLLQSGGSALDPFGTWSVITGLAKPKK